MRFFRKKSVLKKLGLDGQASLKQDELAHYESGFVKDHVQYEQHAVVEDTVSLSSENQRFHTLSEEPQLAQQVQSAVTFDDAQVDVQKQAGNAEESIVLNMMPLNSVSNLNMVHKNDPHSDLEWRDSLQSVYSNFSVGSQSSDVSNDQIVAPRNSMPVIPASNYAEGFESQQLSSSMEFGDLKSLNSQQHTLSSQPGAMEDFPQEPQQQLQPVKSAIMDAERRSYIHNFTVSFKKKVGKHAAFCPSVYDRAGVIQPRLECKQKLDLYVELMTYKLTEMDVHVDSIGNINRHLSRLDEDSKSVMNQILQNIVENALKE